MITLKTVRSMLLGVAVGDALGVPVEFVRREKLKQNPVEGMRSGGSWGEPAGTWSDDTSMTIATMESIARLGRIDLDDIMSNFVGWLKHDEFTANGYTFDVGNTTAGAIRNYINGASVEQCGLRDEDSNGNGSLMRILPIALYTDSLDAVHSVSALTHAHPRSLIGCGIQCLIARELLSGKPIERAVKDGLIRAEDYYSRSKYAGELKHYGRLFDPNFGALDEDEIEGSGYVVQTLEAALWCLLNSDDYRSLALKAVNLGRDTDTVGAVAGGLGGIAYGLEQIPAEWIETLRNKELLKNIASNFGAVLR